MQLLAVVGMHRSGTSLVAGMLRALGWDVGAEEDLMPPQPDNPRGFTEHLPAVRVNNRLLERLGGSWRQPVALPPGWEHDPGLDDLREDAGQVAAGLLARPAPRVLFKDPRLCLTLPFWQTVAPIDRALLVQRPVDAVVRSLLRREDGMDTTEAAQLWLRYSLAALRPDVQLHGVLTNDLLDDDGDALRGLAVALGHEPDEQAVAAAQELVDEQLWGRSTRPVSGTAAPDASLDGPEMQMARHVQQLLLDDLAAWRPALAQLATVPELTAAQRHLGSRGDALQVTNDELRARVEDLRAQAARDQERSERYLAEREHARVLLNRLRAEHGG